MKQKTRHYVEISLIARSGSKRDKRVITEMPAFERAIDALDLHSQAVEFCSGWVKEHWDRVRWLPSDCLRKGP